MERSKNSLLSEQRDQMEIMYRERKDIAKEKSRLATASQKATEKVAKGEPLLITDNRHYGYINQLYLFQRPPLIQI